MRREANTLYEVRGGTAYQLIRRPNAREPFMRVMMPGALQRAVLLYSESNKTATVTGDVLLEWSQAQEAELHEAAKRLKEAVRAA